MVILALAACGRGGPPGPPDIVTGEDLLAALDSAGVDPMLLRTEPAGRFGVGVQIVRVGEAEIEVHEFETQAARQAALEALAPDGRSLGGRPLDWRVSPNVWAGGRLIVAYDGTGGGTILVLNALLGDPLTWQPPPLDEPYPPAVTEAIVALAAQLGIDPGTVSVIGFEPVDWSDACLGAPVDGEACAEVITSGLRVELGAQGQTYIFHTDQLGTQVRGPVESGP